MAADYDFIGEVRGMGLMQAFEIVASDGSKEPDVAKTAAFVDAARDRGLLLGKGGLYGNTVRIAPHLKRNSTICVPRLTSWPAMQVITASTCSTVMH